MVRVKWVGGLFAILLAGACIGLMIKVSSAHASEGNEQVSILMPDIRPDHAEQYLCKAYRVRKDPEGKFIVGFNPKGDSGWVHHMLLYGCQSPGIFQRDSPNFVWDCSEMHARSLLAPDNTLDQEEPDNSFERAPVCEASGKQQILYGWALDAPAIKLPEGVGFKIGGLGNDIEFLVLQVHYGHYDMFNRLPGFTDNSGLVLTVRPNNPDSGITRSAGVLILASVGYVPQGVSKHEIWCEIKDDLEIHPFRFRVHTHKLGRRVKGIKIGRHGGDEHGFRVDETSLIGSRNPQDHQAFYPVNDTKMTLRKGDKVYAFCEFNNDRGHIVGIGQTGDAEMCNFYLMYWTNGTNLLSESQCSSINPTSSYLESLVERYSG